MAIVLGLSVGNTETQSGDFTVATNEQAHTIIAHGGNGSIALQVKLLSGAYETFAVVRAGIQKEKMYQLQGPITYRLYRPAGSYAGADIHNET